MAGGGESNHVHAVDAATGKAIPGWPVDLPTPAPDVAGTLRGVSRAVSSFAAAGGLLLLQTRIDDTIGQNANGPFNYLSREAVLALNPSSGAVVWQYALARAQIDDVNNVPKFFVCPTPAAYGTDGGASLVAVASTLDAVVVVLDTTAGGERARYAVAGATLASPAFANAHLYTTAVNGTTQALGSRVNHAPAAPPPHQYPAQNHRANPIPSWFPPGAPDR